MYRGYPGRRFAAYMYISYTGNQSILLGTCLLTVVGIVDLDVYTDVSSSGSRGGDLYLCLDL